MHLNPYVENVRRELAAVAESGGDEVRDLAARLTSPLEAAIRLTLLQALSDAAAEITRELAPGSVDVRLRGADPEFVVAAPPAGAVRAEPGEEAGPGPVTVSSLVGVRLPEGDGDEGGEGGMVRINLRLPAHLKNRVEAAADGLGVSVNAWLVRAAAAALENEERMPRPPSPTARTRRGIGGSYTGWAR